MCGGSSGYEAIVDVGVIVVAHFKNPLEEDALKLLKRILSFELRALIPLSLFLGASLIMTKYLRLPFKDVNDKLRETLRVSSPAFYEDLKKDDVIRALENSAYYRVESWDAYLLSLAEKFNVNIILSIDERLKEKVKEKFIVVNPFEDKMKEYHDFISRIRRPEGDPALSPPRT